MLEVESTKAVDIQKLSGFAARKEKEALYRKGSRYRIKSIKRNEVTRTAVVKLEEIS